MGQGVDANYCDKQGLTLLHLVCFSHAILKLFRFNFRILIHHLEESANDMHINGSNFTCFYML